MHCAQGVRQFDRGGEFEPEFFFWSRGVRSWVLLVLGELGVFQGQDFAFVSEWLTQIDFKIVFEGRECICFESSVRKGGDWYTFTHNS